MNHIDVRNPRTGQVDYQVPAVSAEQISETTATMRIAQAEWNQAGVDYRSKVLISWAQAILKHANSIVEALSVDTGRRMISHVEVQGIEPCARSAAREVTNSITINAQRELSPSSSTLRHCWRD